MSLDYYIIFKNDIARIKNDSTIVWEIRGIKELEFRTDGLSNSIRIIGKDDTKIFEIFEDILFVIDGSGKIMNSYGVKNYRLLERVMGAAIIYDMFHIDYENKSIAYSIINSPLDYRSVCISEFDHLMHPKMKNRHEWEVYDMLSSSYKSLMFNKSSGGMIPSNFTFSLAEAFKEICESQML